MTGNAASIRRRLANCFSRRTVLLTAAVLGPAIAFPLLRAQWQNRAVNEALAAIRARGEPVTATDLDTLYERPPEQVDATHLYACDEKVWASEVQAVAQQLEIENGEVVLPRLSEPWSGQRATEAFLAAVVPYRERWHEASRRGGSARYAVRFEDGLNALVPHVNQVSEITNYLILEAYDHARHGRFSDVTDSLLAALRAASSLRGEPLLPAQLARTASHRRIVQAMSLMVSEGDFSPPGLASLQSELERTEFHEGTRLVLWGERVVTIGVIRDPLNLDPQRRSKGRLLDHVDDFLVSFQTPDRMLRYLSFMEHGIAMAALPLAEGLAIIGGTPMSHGAFPDDPLLQLFANPDPALAAMRAEARATIANQLGIVALALARYRQAHPSLPASLDDLVPKYLSTAPLDLALQAPFLYTVDGDELVLASRWRDPDATLDPRSGGDAKCVLRWKITSPDRMNQGR